MNIIFGLAVLVLVIFIYRTAYHKGLIDGYGAALQSTNPYYMKARAWLKRNTYNGRQGDEYGN